MTPGDCSGNENHKLIDSFDPVGYITHGAAVLVAYLELQGDLQDFSRTHQGLCLLVASRICREIHALRCLIVVQKYESINDNNGKNDHEMHGCMQRKQQQQQQQQQLESVYRPPIRFLQFSLWILASPWTAASLALCALASATAEVIDQSSSASFSKQGLGGSCGHLGAIILALMDLMELIQEPMSTIIGKQQQHGDNGGLGCHMHLMYLQQILEWKWLKLFLSVLATCLVIMEALDEKESPGEGGASNGFLLLAIFRLLRTMGHGGQIIRYLWKQGCSRYLLKLVDKAGALWNEIKSLPNKKQAGNNIKTT